MKFSLILRHCQDYPAIWFTVQDKWLRLLENYSPQDFEVIIVENGSTDNNLRMVRRLGGRNPDDPTKWYREDESWGAPRRLNMKYIELPQQMHSAASANVGAWKASGELLVLMDSHVLVNNDWFTLAEKFMDENQACGVLHNSVAWNARDQSRRGYQYKLTLDTNFWGRWDSHRLSNSPYKIAASGIASVVIRRKSFVERYKGFPSMLRYYGGGEPYIDLIAWMMGDEVWLHPDMYTIHFALTPSRGYKRSPLIEVRNAMLSSYVLGGEKYALSVLYNALCKYEKQYPDWAAPLAEHYNEAIRYGRMRRLYVMEHTKYSLNELLEFFKENKIFH